MDCFNYISNFDDGFNVPRWMLGFADTMQGTLSNRKWPFTKLKKKSSFAMKYFFLY